MLLEIEIPLRAKPARRIPTWHSSGVVPKDRQGRTFSRQAAILMAFFCHCYQKSGTAMARDVNPLKSEQITLSVNAQTVWYLDRLVETGLYGNNRTEAARVAIYDHCKFLISQGSLEMVPRLVSRDITVAR